MPSCSTYSDYKHMVMAVCQVLPTVALWQATLFVYAEIWLMMMLVLKCCEKKTLVHD